jgi:hypothetical protein
MKKLSAVIGFCSLLMMFSGCDWPNAETSAQPADSNAVWNGIAPAQEAMPDFLANSSKTAAFPESMVGVWKSAIPNIDWAFKFEPDGSIKKIAHSLAGLVNIEEGGSTGTGPDAGSYYVFMMGSCGTRYVPETQTVKVKIIVDRYKMKLPAGELEGRIEDYFEGPVSEDGKIWNVKWWNFGWLKDAHLPDINEIKNNPVPLVFTKLDKEDANKF